MGMTSLPKIKPPIVAFDWGGQRIGVCISPDGSMTFPREHIQAGDEETTLSRVSQFLRTEGIQTIVLGLPLSLDGTETEMAKKIRAIGTKITDFTSLPVFFEDERLTTKEAEKRRVSSFQKSIDRLAAQIVLQNFLAKQ